ncbi:hypothetical protein Tco_0935624 [Tanacetum coccineum]
MDESNKMQKYILKQQFEGFTVSKHRWDYKGYGEIPKVFSCQLGFLEQVVEYDLEKNRLNGKCAMILLWNEEVLQRRLVESYRFDAKELVGFDKNQSGNATTATKQRHFARAVVEQRMITGGGNGWNPGNKDGSRME